jgi:hypothetical protein
MRMMAAVALPVALCPLMAKSGRFRSCSPRPLFSPKETSRSPPLKSASDPRRTLNCAAIPNTAAQSGNDPYLQIGRNSSILIDLTTNLADVDHYSLL